MSNLTKSVFYAPTPLAVINAQEGLKAFKINKTDAVLLIFRYKNVASKTILKKSNALINNDLWGEIKYVDVKGSMRWQSKMRILQAFLISKRIGVIDKLFIVHNDTDLALALIKYMKYNDLVMYDDGVATLTLESQEVDERGLSLGERALNFKRPNDYILFTSFDVLESKSVSRVVRNNYSYLRSKVAKQKLVNEAVIFGQPLVELGYISKELYFERIREYVDQLASQIDDVYYVPHYFEEAASIEELKTTLTLKVKNLDMPPEWEFSISADTRPKYVASFISTCLFTLPSLIPEGVNYSAFDIHESIEDDAVMQRFRVCYDSLRRNGNVEVV